MIRNFTVEQAVEFSVIWEALRWCDVTVMNKENFLHHKNITVNPLKLYMRQWAKSIVEAMDYRLPTPSYENCMNIRLQCVNSLFLGDRTI